MIEREDIKEVLHIFLQFRESDDLAITSELKNQGLSLEDAERVSAFLPSAFCRIAFCHELDIIFPESYKVKGIEREFLYKDETIYKLGLEIASSIYHNEPELSEIFNSIVTRSAEFNAVNNALNKGVEISGSRLSAINYFGYKTLGRKRGLLSRIFS